MSAPTAPTASGLAASTLLGGRYELVELLGQGGNGAVYRAKQKPLDREVAVKTMLPHAATDRFAREVALVQRLEHPNTVRLFDFGVADDATPFMVFELIRGRTLEQEIANGPMPAARVAHIATQILKSLMEAHALGIVHRDVKPANLILVDYAGERDFVKVLDFGVAREIDPGGAGAITTAGQIVGTASYMAPEQVRGERVDARADLYALGLVVAEALSGTVVFREGSDIQIWMKQASADPPPIPPMALASILGGVVARATQKSVEARFRSAEEMLAAIESAIRAPTSGALAATAMAPPIHVSSPPRPVTSIPPAVGPTAVFHAPPPVQSVAATSYRAPIIGSLIFVSAILVLGGMFALVGYFAQRPRRTIEPAQNPILRGVEVDPADETWLAHGKDRIESQGYKVFERDTPNPNVVFFKVRKEAYVGGILFFAAPSERTAEASGVNAGTGAHCHEGRRVVHVGVPGKFDAAQLCRDLLR